MNSGKLALVVAAVLTLFLCAAAVPQTAMASHKRTGVHAHAGRQAAARQTAAVDSARTNGTAGAGNTGNTVKAQIAPPTKILPQPAHFTCGQTIYLLSAEPPPVKTATAPPPTATAADKDLANKTNPQQNQANQTNKTLPAQKIYPLKMPACDDQSTAFLLQMKGGHLEMVPSPPPAPTPIPYDKIAIVGVVTLVASLVLFYYLVQYSLFRQLHQQQREFENRLAAPLTKQSSPELGEPMQKIALRVASQAIGDSSVLKDLSARVSKLEQREKPKTITPLEENFRISAPAVKPPVITATPLSAYEEFIAEYNEARSNPDARDSFARRYKPRNLQLSNPTDVTRSNSRPLFDWGQDGDLLAVKASIIEMGKWPDDHHYLVPLYDKRWGYERMKGGCWEHFFDISTTSGLNELKNAALVKPEGNSWEISDGRRGEIVWDANAAS